MYVKCYNLFKICHKNEQGNLGFNLNVGHSLAVKSIRQWNLNAANDNTCTSDPVVTIF